MGTDLNLKVNPNESELNLNWDSLSSKERDVLICMLTSMNDAEAIRKSPIRKTRYYELKKKLFPIKEQLAMEVGRKALETIRGSSLEAARTLTQLLNNPNPNVRVKAAEQILDRVLGTSQRQETVRPNITIIGIQGVTEEKLRKLTEPPEYFTNNSSTEEAELTQGFLTDNNE